ncbi:pyridoxal phosphate-dependent transferase [Dioszegia hungarica]|uniref:Pyridoxal phosphate-dependent transferase n=1 Tax=Dioszegia hungarica TaxID=4972 RepID=A0AA38LVY3_9TREE|nr:pyridoxal phosphate-dependent transferase [Dioszegia hungarica]KAI9635941.1 pyridoxal phosphate-dependent transferase [Dioszegia hungarica]
MTTASPAPRNPNRLSLQPPAGLPALPASPSPLSSARSATFPRPINQTRPGIAFDLPDSDPNEASTRGTENSEYTLIGCLAGLSISTLPSLSSLDGESEEQRRIYLGPKLSDRATGGPDAGPLIERFSCLFKDQYNCATNPKGIVSMGVAENFLMEKECIELFSKALAKNLLASDLSYGNDLWGSRRIKSALAGFYNDWFDPAEPIQPDHMITGNGCSAVLDQLFYTLMDEGEAILIAAPYYTGFDRDLIGRARVRIVPVHIPDDLDPCGPESLEAFETQLQQLKSEGIVTRAVILCNPQNPLGRTYPRSTLLAYAKFCEEQDLHLVSDEIYALSVYDTPDWKEAVPFTSMMSVDVEKELGMDFDRARVHVVYGMSKDFCANGLRVGSLISQHNPLLLRAMANISMLMKISSPADIIWSSLLTDSTALTAFISENRRRLAEAHALTRGWFTARGVPVANSNAGHFIWVNLGGKLGFEEGEAGVKEEKKVFQELLDGGVYIAPGTAYHYDKPGWYRVTFSIARDNLLVGLGKIERILDLTVTA